MTTRPQDMGPADLAPNTAPPETHTAEQAVRVQRDQFYNSLPPGEKERVLEILSAAADRGASAEEAWEEATRAVEGNL